MALWWFRSKQTVVTITSLLFSVMALAQGPKDAGQDAKPDAAEQSDQHIEEIVVVGSRRTELLQEVGLAISAIQPEEFVTAGLVTLEDAIDYTAGVHFSGYGNWGSGVIFMRGATQEGPTPVTAIYIDDVPITPEVPGAFAAENVLDAMMGDIERVEVIKGPQGTLYGAGAVGGVIRYVTRDPSLEEASGRVAIDLSYTAHGEWSERYKAYGSLPIVKGKLAIGVTALYADQGGYLDRIDPASGSIESDVNPFDLNAGSLTGLWQLSANTSLKFLASRYESEFPHFLQDVNYDYPSFVPTYGFYITDAPPAPGTRKFDTYAATLNVDFDWASLTYVNAISDFGTNLEFDATPEFGELIDELVGAVPGTNTLPVIFDAGADKRTQELRLTSDDNNSLQWLTGIYLTDVDTHNVQQGFGVPSDYHLFTFDFPSKHREFSIYGDLTWFLRPNLDITFGARHSDIDVSSFRRNSGLFGAGDPDGEVIGTGKTDDRVTTFLLGARWRPSSQSSIYLRFANGYRPPVPRTIASFDETDGQESDVLAKSDYLWSYEIGAKGTRLKGKLAYDVALWAIDWSAFQAIVTVNSISGLGNSESDRSAYGFESTLRYRPTDEFLIDASVGYAESSLDEDAPTLGALKGERSLSLPRWTGSLRGTYEFPLAGFDGSVSAGLRYVGSYATGYRSGAPGCGCSVNFPVDAYILLDSSVTLSTERYGLTLYGTNLLDETALALARANDVFGNTLAYGISVRPRTIGAYLWTNF